MLMLFNKEHGQDDTSIRMINLCSKSAIKPLSMVFKIFIDTGTFPDLWKRVIPYYCNDNMSKHNN